MRTTVDIPDPIYRQLKSRAQQGRSVKELIRRGVEAELHSTKSGKTTVRVTAYRVEKARLDEA